MNIQKLSRIQKQFLLLIADIFFLFLAVFLSFSLRLGEFHLLNIEQAKILLLIGFISVPIFIHFGFYKVVIRHISIKALWSIFQAVTISVSLWGVIAIYFSFQMPRTVPLIAGTILLILVGGSRILARILFAAKINKLMEKNTKKNILIYGAGDAGVQLAKALEYDGYINVAGFIDDDKELHGKYILGLNVYSFNNAVKYFSLTIKTSDINEILLALPSISRTQRSNIIHKLETLSIKVRALPGLSELAQGNININAIKEINITDLLDRNIVKPNQSLLTANITGKSVLVTGAGGSIGSELCRQIFNLKPKKIILFEMSELALYQIEKEMLTLKENTNSQVDILPVLGNVVNQARVERVCRAFKIHTIYHAAAYKHVPMVEKNISEGIRNNIFGTFNCAQAAINAGVKTFVLISTDKAVRPTNIMGATKRFSELILQGLSLPEKKNRTCFTMVRFGNVLGSSGSVIPLFREQIAKGKAITVTDAKIIRYFMSITEASQLVIQAGAMGKGGDVFVLDMGKPVKILDLAKRVIHLSGYQIKDNDNPHGDIEIHFTGLRPGEKLYEELLIGDNVSETEHPLIRRAKENTLSWYKITKIMDDMNKALSQEDDEMLRNILQYAIEGYKPQCGVVDVLYKEKKQPPLYVYSRNG